MVALVLLPLPALASQVDDRPDLRALSALNSLGSVVAVGVTLSEYSHYVLEAKIAVDRELASWNGSADSKNEAWAAMELYIIAKNAWAADVSRSLSPMPSGLHTLCPLRGEIMRRSVAERPESEMSFGVIGKKDLQILWACARERTRRVESAIKEK